MYGQMTAGSWIYIGTQGIVQGTYETFATIADQRYGGTLAGTLTLTGGCGGMGGAHSWVRNTPTGRPDCTSIVSSGASVVRVRTMASKDAQLRAARPVPP